MVDIILSFFSLYLSVLYIDLVHPAVKLVEGHRVAVTIEFVVFVGLLLFEIVIRAAACIPLSLCLCSLAPIWSVFSCYVPVAEVLIEAVLRLLLLRTAVQDHQVVVAFHSEDVVGVVVERGHHPGKLVTLLHLFLILVIDARLNQPVHVILVRPL